MLYKRGDIWWYKFNFQGTTIYESTGLTNKEAAREVEHEQHNLLRKRRRGLRNLVRVPMFSVAAGKYIEAKRGEWAAKTAIIEATNLGHLEPVFGNRLLNDIRHDDVAEYRDQRQQDGAADKTISLEIGTLRGIMLHHDLDAEWRSKKENQIEEGPQDGESHHDGGAGCIARGVPAQPQPITFNCRDPGPRMLPTLFRDSALAVATDRFWSPCRDRRRIEDRCRRRPRSSAEHQGLYGPALMGSTVPGT